MTIVEMLEQSGVLTLLGMGVVFSFLLLLIFLVTIAGKVIHALGLDKDTAAAPSVQPPAERTTAVSLAGLGAVTTDADATITAVISASVIEYQRTH
ncbi:OadG family transporter subunit [Breznakiellaceae bacterium SP9]